MRLIVACLHCPLHGNGSVNVNMSIATDTNGTLGMLLKAVFSVRYVLTCTESPWMT
jgi:hypothetical protein